MHEATVHARYSNAYYNADSYRAICPCGWQSGRVFDADLARDFAARHNDG